MLQCVSKDVLVAAFWSVSGYVCVFWNTFDKTRFMVDIFEVESFRTQQFKRKGSNFLYMACSSCAFSLSYSVEILLFKSEK